MIPLFKPYMPTDFPELEKILHSGALSYGKYGKSFEVEIGNYIGNANLLTTNTYTNAINIALTSLGIKSGDEVIASPMACLASNQPLVTFGLSIKWADIDAYTGTLSPESVKSLISRNTKLIFHNHFCGYVGYVDEINSIANEYGIPVIDDCVEAFGSRYKGNITGNLGTTATIFSFQTVRLPNTIDGGAIVFNDNTLVEKAKLIRDFGINRSEFRDALGEISKDCDISMKGFAGTMSEMNSYIGCLQMKDLSLLLAKQKQNALNWRKIIGNGLEREEIEPNYWVYGLICENKIEELKRFREKGYYSSGVHLPNNYYSIFGQKTELKGVEDFYNKFIAIPCGWWI